MGIGKNSIRAGSTDDSDDVSYRLKGNRINASEARLVPSQPDRAENSNVVNDVIASSALGQKVQYYFRPWGI